MRKLLLLPFTIVLLFSFFFAAGQQANTETGDNPSARQKYTAELEKDPALGYVPYHRLFNAINHTEALKAANRNSNTSNFTAAPLPWIERGPIFDSVGPSNGNTRGGSNTAGGHTSGRMRAFLLDTLNDPTGNTAFLGGVAGGLWKCTNFLSVENNWAPVNDRFDNLAISSIAQDPTNPQIIYFATGEPTDNADRVTGLGVWKSTNGGTTFTRLNSTTNYMRCFKIGCDAAGNVYLACRITTVPVNQQGGLFRSTNGGTSWTDITPNDLNALSSNSCTDFEFTASGNLNATFGYRPAGNVVNHRYTTAPATVAPGSWSSGAGFRVSNAPAIRTEMAVMGDILYAVTITPGYHTDSCYKSIDGGANWTKQNTVVMPTGLGSGQGWYNISLAINPLNTSELISGGLDGYRSVNDGATWTRFTFWVTTAPYVHADHHYAQYWISGGQTRIIMGTDGGIFYSANNGTTFTSKNKNIGIKQFYSAAIHPNAGSPYLLAGAQDNGTHALSNPGLSYSIEVTGGDGCIVHINQQNPLIQFGSYVYNQYRRSVNGGATWQSVNLSGSTGQFVNPFDYDDAQNIMYCGNSAGTVRRWDNANTTNTSSIITVTNMTGSLLSVKYSPYTANRIFFGTNNGRLFRLDNANAATSTAAVDITGSTFPSGTIICVNTGTDDNNLVATYSNFGVNNVWVSTNGGTSWTAVDGDLPDMPVRWAMFEPGTNSKLYLATEAGIYTTTNINGASTQWLPETTFPTVSTYMLKMRASDSTIVAGTHGRGLWTAKIPAGTAINPTVTINQAAAQPDPTNVSPINFTVVFDQAVTGFATGDVTLTGTAGATTGTVTGSGTTYNVAVSGMTSSGTVIATIPAGVCINGTGDPNDASTSTDNTVTFNLVVANPNVTINQAAAQPDPTSTSPINFTVVFDQVVTGFATGDVVLSGTAGATTGIVTGSGTTYNVAVSGMTGPGTVIATIPAGVATNASSQPNNPSTSTDNTVTYVLPNPPTVTINQAAAQPDPTSVSPINFTVVFNQSVTGFATGDVTLSGTAGATTGIVTGSGTTYNVAVSGMTGTGTVIATVPAGVATNTLGDPNLASTSTDNTVTFNFICTPPVVDPVPNQTVCAGTPTAPVNFTSTPSGATFAWTNNTPSIGLAASGNGNIASFIPVNNTALPITATITVTPTIGGTSAPTTIPLNAQTGTFGGSARGYWFTAPTAFTMTALRVPTDASAGNQHIAVVRFTGATPPPAFPGTTNAFTTLFLTQNNGTVGSIPVNIPIAAGEVIGILGTRGADVNSYSAPPNITTIAGFPVPLTRMGMQFPLASTAPQQLWQESAFQISRVFFDYTTGTGGGCAGPARTFTITVNPNPTIVIVADPGTTICEGDPTLLTVRLGTSSPIGTLYTQGTTPVNGSPSQVFEPANAAFTSQSADDFIVPAGSTWTVTQITANGIGTGNPTSVNVFFYANTASNLPGAAIASFNNVASFVRTGGNYTVTLPSSINLSGGTYWVSIQVNMSFATGGQWFWGNFGATNINSEYAWQNPGGGFATPCTSWGYGGTGCNVGGGPGNRNNIFSIIGSSLADGGPLPPGYTFLWSPAAGLSSTTSNPVAASPMNTTTYTVVVTGPGVGGCSRTASILITVNKRPTVTTQPVNRTNCVGTSATFTVGGTGTGLTYQWQQSTTGCAGPWTNLTNGGAYAGVNTATLTVNPVTLAMNGYAYRAVLSGACAAVNNANISNCVVLTVNPNPVITVTPAVSCGSAAGICNPITASGNADTYTWSPITGLFLDCAATIPYTGTNTATVYARPTALTVYTVTGTFTATGCFTTATAVVNYTPPAPTVTPNPVTMCLGDPAVLLRSSSSTAGSGTFNSGPLALAIPDGPATWPQTLFPGVATPNLAVSGIPAGATITGMSVKLNLTHTYIADMVIVLKAPNGAVFNLDANINRTGGPGANFINTIISSASNTPLSAGAPPYTGTFRPDAVGATYVAAGFTFPGGPTSPAGYIPTVTNFSGLYTTPNGNWTLGIYDWGAGDLGTLTNWELKIDYLLGVPATPAVWSPIGGLYSNAAANIPYVAGTAVDSVWVRPTPAGVYTYQATVQSLPVQSTFTNPSNIVINASGPGNPYPSNLNVSGLPTSGVSVDSVRLTGISHTWGDDIDILLQSPTGQNVVLMSDVGGIVAVPNATYTFRDGAPALNAGAANPTGTYRPTNNGAADTWPAPGPGAITQATPTLASFGSANNVNGAWKLFVFDDVGGDAGNISGGYTIYFNASIPACTSPARTVTVTVHSPTIVTTQPVNQTICTDKVATFTVVAGGTGPFTYQWQVSTNGGNPPWTNITNGGVYSGATTSTLTITAPPVSMSGYFYRVIITGAAPCAAATSNTAVLTVNPLPVVVINASPHTSLFPGLTTTLSSTVSPNAPAPIGGYTWLRNGTVVGGNTATHVVDIDGLGDYTLRVTDINGCTSTSNMITIKDSVTARCFIYPNPTSGLFQVRYYSVANNVLPRTLTVYDAKGDRVFTKMYTIGRPYDRMDVDMRAYSKGLYWVEIGDMNGSRISMCRVVIQ